MLPFLALPDLVQAQFEYIVEDSSITITKYTGPGGDVVIPERINGLAVTSIGDDAFTDCTGLTAMYFEGNAPTLGGQWVFQGTSVTIFFFPGTSGWESTFGGRPAIPWGLAWGSPVQGDMDGDEAVDRNDLSLMVASRNHPAVNSEDPRDLDGDGRITVLDARFLATLFSVPGGLLHAVSTPDGVVLDWAESAGAVKLQSTSDLRSGL